MNDQTYRARRDLSRSQISDRDHWALSPLVITYRLSYRDLAAMLAGRGIIVPHTTIMRWVLRYVPEYERRRDRFTPSVNSSWRMDKTAVSVRFSRLEDRRTDECSIVQQRKLAS
jgi:transposase-like protein